MELRAACDLPRAGKRIGREKRCEIREPRERIRNHFQMVRVRTHETSGYGITAGPLIRTRVLPAAAVKGSIQTSDAQMRLPS